MKTSDAIFAELSRYVDTVFFVPGGGAMHLVDSLGRSGLRRVSALHEQGAALMACGYAQYRNGLGVCLTTTGPGATNAITGCAAAWMDSLPVLFISGQARSDSLIGETNLRTRGVQEIDIIGLVYTITKHAERWYPGRGEHNLMALRRMIMRCLDGRPGPCWLDVPLDVQAEEVNV